MTLVVHTRADLAEVLTPTGPRAVVMTMGALHDGHAALMSAARSRLQPAGQVVVTDVRLGGVGTCVFDEAFDCEGVLLAG